jgi:hypothetical protein
MLTVVQQCQQIQNFLYYGAKLMKNLKSVKHFTNDNPSFTEGGMRSLIFNEELNGLKGSGAILRVGRKILIDEPKFYEWIKSQNEMEVLS